MESNYEKQVYHARELFLRYDQKEMAEKFGLEQDAAYLYIKLLGCTCRIERTSGAIEMELPESGTADSLERSWVPCLDYQVVMTIYDSLCYAKDTPHLSGDWCPLQSLQVTMSSPSPERLHRATALAFSGKVQELRRACQMLGGERQAVPASADACYRINIFPFFPVIFQFWDGDEEFEPKIMILWDRNSLRFMHFETLYYAMNHLLETLRKLLEE